jgi:hypothetical protein
MQKMSARTCSDIASDEQQVFVHLSQSQACFVVCDLRASAKVEGARAASLQGIIVTTHAHTP